MRYQQRDGTQAIERAFAVLKETSSANTTGTTVALLADKTGLNRTTVFRILECLLHEGAMRYDAKTKRYYLGPLNVELGIAARQRVDLQTLAAPSLSRLATSTGDTIFLMVRSDDFATQKSVVAPGVGDALAAIMFTELFAA